MQYHRIGVYFYIIIYGYIVWKDKILNHTSILLMIYIKSLQLF